MSEAPATYKRFKTTWPGIAGLYESLSGGVLEAGPLSERERRLVRLGVALGTKSAGAIKSALRKAADAGIAPDELRHAVVLSLVNIGISDMLMAMGWTDELSSVAASTDGNHAR